MTPLRTVLAAAVVVVFDLATVRIAQGSSEEEHQPLTGAALAASKQRVAAGGPQVAEGAEEFEGEGCDQCHTVSATGADGRLGPQLDLKVRRDDVEEITEEIAERDEASLMRRDYGTHVPREEIDAIAAFLKAAAGDRAGGEDEEDEG
jgi:mono/diheme cytochrome c family protein